MSGKVQGPGALGPHLDAKLKGDAGGPFVHRPKGIQDRATVASSGTEAPPAPCFGRFRPGCTALSPAPRT